MIIRAAERRDRQAVADIHAASWLDAYRAYLSPQYLAHIDQRLDEHWAKLELGEADLLLLAETARETLGFLLARDGEPFFINTLHVRPGHRSSGVGRRLMAHAARHYRQQGRAGAYLDVIESNHRAIDFYQRLGGLPGGLNLKLVGDTMQPNLRIDFPDLATIIAAAGNPR